jgi:hypothetical protein
MSNENPLGKRKTLPDGNKDLHGRRKDPEMANTWVNI